LSAVEVALLIEVVVDRGVNRAELLQGLHPAEALSRAERFTQRSIVERVISATQLLMRAPAPIWRRTKVPSTMTQMINALAVASVVAAVAFPVLAGPTNSFTVLNVGSIDAAHLGAHRLSLAWLVADRPQIGIVSRTFRLDSAAKIIDQTAPVQPDQVQIHSRFEGPANALKMSTVHFGYGPAGLGDDASTIGFSRHF
jgi:hypothetical protein